MIRRILSAWLFLCLTLVADAASITQTGTIGFGGPSVPTFSVGCGTYGATQTVSLASATSGASIYYTTNGATPTTASALYSSALSVSATTTLNAISVAPITGKSAIANCTYTISASSSAVKWHPGHYADSQCFVTLSNSNGCNGLKQSEITLVRAGPSQVLGYTAQYFWPVFENSTAGTYTFNQLDIDYVQLTTGSTSWSPGNTFPGYSSPRRLGIWIVGEDYFSSNPTNEAVPSYVANNSAYGPIGPDGVHYGYGTIDGSMGLGTGSAPAFWRTSVMNRVILLGRNIGSHVLPDGYTVDTSPYVEFIAMYPESVISPVNSSGVNYDSSFSIAGFAATIQALDTAMGPLGSGVAFPHTNVVGMINFFGGAQDAQALTLSQEPSGTAQGGSDLFGLSSGVNGCAGLCGLTSGQMAYAGYNPLTNSGAAGYQWQTTGGTDLRGVIPGISQASGTELGMYYTPIDVFNQGNGTLHDTHIYWSILDNGTANGAAWLGTATSISQWLTNPSGYGGTLYMIITNPLTHTGCPSSYTGGCNTSSNLPAANDDHFHQRLDGRFQAAA